MSLRRVSASRPAAERGVALVTVLVVVLMGLIAIVGAFRMANLAESVTGGYADYSRTYAAAEAMLRDAETDVRGRLPDTANATSAYALNADGGLGLPCRNGAPAAPGLIFVGCRTTDTVPGSSNTYQWIPRTSEEYDAVHAIAQGANAATRCFQGICVPDSLATLADLHTPVMLANVFAAGSAYGQYTGAAPLVAESNPSLSLNTTATALPADGQPWSRYWIEVFRHAEAVNSGFGAGTGLTPDPTAPFVYRITAIAQGRKPGSRVILKETFILNPAAQNQ